MENEVKRNDDIKTILTELSSDDSAVVISDADAEGKLEFRFENPHKMGLVFEEDSRSQTLHFETDDGTVVEPEQTEKLVAEPPVTEPEPPKEEFSIPETFDSKAEEAAIVNETTKIWSTYVPRFTEVSETYRMSDDPRPRPEKKEKTVADSKATAADDIDPTGESVYDESVVDAVVVNVTQKAEEEEQQFSVYKFSESQSEDTPEESSRERTVEDEIAEIEELFTKKEDEPTPVEAPTVDDDLELLNIKKEDPAQKKSYDLPDPEHDGRVQVVDYYAAEGSSLADAPEGADDSSTIKDKKKGRASEFTTHMQRDSFKDRFIDSIISARIRLIAAIILVLAMLAFENVSLFGPQLESFLRPATFPGLMAFSDFQFALCVFILAIPEVARAARALGSAKVLPELLSLVSLVLLAIYTLCVCLIAPHGEYPLFGILCAVQSLAAIISTCYKRKADFTAFKRISKNGEKRVLDKKATRLLERENLALDGVVDETKSSTARIFKTTFVSDFFKRSSQTVENSRNIIVTLCTAVLVALVGAIIAFFIGDGIMDAVKTFTAFSLFTLPAISILVHKLPFYHSSLECEAEESAIIGENSLYEYSAVDVIAFEDTDIFGSEDVNLKRIIHYGDVDNMMKAMRQMSAIFANVGGPLDVIFSNSLDRKCPPATKPEIERDGIAGMVDGHIVRAGTAAYMERHGIKIPEGAASVRAGISDSTKVMFGAEDGVVYVQFHIRYSFSEEFTMILPTLKKEKIVPLIYTRDPNISGELISTLTNGDDCIRVLKKNTVIIGEDKIYRRISTGVVTSSDKIDTINVLLLSKKYTRLMKALSIMELVSMGVGCAAAIALAIAGALGISSAFFFGWHAIWFLVLYIISRKSFTLKKKEDNSDD